MFNFNILLFFVCNFFLNRNSKDNQKEHSKKTNPPQYLINTAVMVIKSKYLSVVDVR